MKTFARKLNWDGDWSAIKKGWLWTRVSRMVVCAHGYISSISWFLIHNWILDWKNHWNSIIRNWIWKLFQNQFSKMLRIMIRTRAFQIARISFLKFLCSNIHYYFISWNHLKNSGMNAYPRYRSSTPKKTVSDLGFDYAASLLRPKNSK